MTRRAALAVLNVGGCVDRVSELLDGYDDVHRDGPELAVRRVLLDTFDWRVRRAGGALGWSDGTLTWRDRDTGHLRTVLQEACPRWPADVGTGPVHDLLADACGVRILLPLVEIDVAVRRYRVLGDLDMAIAWIDLERGSVDDGPPVATLTVRGYDGEHAGFVRRLAEDIDVPRVDADPDDLAYAAAGLEPGGYTGRLEVALDPTMAANEAIARTCRHLMQTMRANEEGVIADLDTEFLHDFRVAVRRTRSMLGASRRVLPRPVRDDYRKRFKWLGDITTPVRDLDVFSLAIPDYADASARGSLVVLQPLADLVAADHQQAHAALVSALLSQDYTDLVREWSETLDTLPTDPETTEADAPIVEVARRRIWRAYRVVRRDGRVIAQDSPPEMLHQLRKDAKQLRYLLEAFGALFDADRTQAAVSELKRVQDNLGAFQDGEVQSQELRDFATRIARQPTNADTVMALGVLARHLEQLQHDARAQFAKRFARFDGSDNRARYEELFSPAAARSRPSGQESCREGGGEPLHTQEEPGGRPPPPT
jgi:CHAD domain-containing protein